MPGLSFKYPASALVGASGADVTPDESNLLLGQLNSTEVMGDEYRFEAGAALPVPCRASVTRLCFMKLLGTGVLAAIAGMRASSTEAAMSCAYAAAVNAVACTHYFFIVRTRPDSDPLETVLERPWPAAQ